MHLSIRIFIKVTLIAMNDASQSLGKSAAWIGGSQLAMRLARILSTIVVARLIAPELLGVAAIALAVNEISHVFSRNATNSKIIRAEECELISLSDTAYYVNWLVGAAVFLIQCLVGFGLSWVYDDVTIFYLVSVLGFTYLLLPVAQVHSALNLRQEKIALIATTEIQQTVVDAALTIAMVLLGFGVWSLVLPKILVVPIWIRAHRRANTYIAPKRFTLSRLSDHLSFNSRVVGVEVLGVIRHNIDYVLIGFFLGMEALGIYYFAYNAGLGLSRGFILSLNNAFYPYLCAAKHQSEELQKRFRQGLSYMLLLMIPLLSLQAFMADIYVPILFGQQWVERDAAVLVSLLCMAGIPLLVTEAGSQYLRAQDRPLADLQWHLSYSAIFIIAIFIGVQWGLIGVVVAVLLSQYLAAPLHYVFIVNKQQSKNQQTVFAKSRGLIG